MKYLSSLLAQIDIDPGELNIPKPDDVPQSVNDLDQILTIVFGLAGVIAVLVIVIAGMQFILSRGDPQKTATSRNAIIYAAIGLGISVLAFSIVRFVVGSVQ